MKMSDPLIGASLISLGSIIALTASQLPPARHLDYGPGFLPTLVAVGLIICGSLLIFRDVFENGIPKFRIERPSWLSGKARTSMLLLAIGIAIYPVFMPYIGFFFTTILSLVAIFRAGNVAWPFTLATSIFAALCCQVLFVLVLRVPLPGPSIEWLANSLPIFLIR